MLADDELVGLRAQLVLVEVELEREVPTRAAERLARITSAVERFAAEDPSLVAEHRLFTVVSAFALHPEHPISASSLASIDLALLTPDQARRLEQIEMR
jgi:hypothetical protein